MSTLKHKKLSLTIGIPAHNEAANIANMLTSVLKQKSRNYSLQRIIVLCDGCTDNTAQIVQKIARTHKKISVITDGRHIGKNSRLNQLFRKSRSAICVVLDADIALAQATVIEELVEPFSNPQVGLVSGNDRPFQSSTWFEELATVFYDIWYEIRENLNGGDSIHNVHGPIYALRKNVYQHIRLLTTVNADDHQVYFWNKRLGFRMSFAKRAVIYYRIPKTVREYFVQHTRYLVSGSEFSVYYGKWVQELYAVPKSAIVNGILTVFLRKPHMVLGALALQVALRIMKKTGLKNTSRGKWKSISSSKTAIPL